MSELVINKAVLEILDYTSGNEIYSEQTMNLEDAVNGSYVKKYIKKVTEDIGLRKGELSKDSSFYNLLDAYKKPDADFRVCCKELAEYISDCLKDVTDQPYDLLMVDYRYDDVPYLAVLFIPNQKAYTHITEEENGRIVNHVMMGSGFLSSPGKKLRTFFIVNLLNDGVQYVDEENWKDDIHLLQDRILMCTSQKSTKEVLQETNDIVNEIAEKCDENPALLLSKYKNYIQNASEESDTISKEDLAVNVFNESEEMQDTFLSASLEHELPEEMDISARPAIRKMKNQRIRTDSGIEISFPTEYSGNPDVIEFINNPDGTISIEIKHIEKIINRG